MDLSANKSITEKGLPFTFFRTLRKPYISGFTLSKVFVDESILDYQWEMAEIVGRIIKQKFIAGVKSGSVVEPPLAQADLLPPPKIERLDLEFYDGRVKDFISIYTSDDFGIVNLYLIFRDEQGNLAPALACRCKC